LLPRWPGSPVNERSHTHDARIVEQDIDWPKGDQHLLGKGSCLTSLGKIGADQPHLSPHALDHYRRYLCLLLAGAIGYRYIGPFTSEAKGDGTSESSAGARHRGGPACDPAFCSHR
jgi:hypothetical protein